MDSSLLKQLSMHFSALLEINPQIVSLAETERNVFTQIVVEDGKSYYSLIPGWSGFSKESGIQTDSRYYWNPNDPWVFVSRLGSATLANPDPPAPSIEMNQEIAESLLKTLEQDLYRSMEALALAEQRRKFEDGVREDMKKLLDKQGKFIPLSPRKAAEIPGGFLQ